MKKHRLISCLIGVLISLFILILFEGGKFEGLENKTIDHRFKKRGARATTDRVAIVTVDEYSLDQRGQFPWERSVHGALVDILTRKGAKVIAFDMVFVETDRMGSRHDKIFARAAKRSGRVIQAMFFESQFEDGSFADPSWPIERLRRHSPVGSVNIKPEPDGVVRKIILTLPYKEETIPSIWLAALAAYQGTTFEKVLEEYYPPVDESNQAWINFAGGFEKFPHISYTDVLNDKVRLRYHFFEEHLRKSGVLGEDLSEKIFRMSFLRNTLMMKRTLQTSMKDIIPEKIKGNPELIEVIEGVVLNKKVADPFELDLLFEAMGPFALSLEEEESLALDLMNQGVLWVNHDVAQKYFQTNFPSRTDWLESSVSYFDDYFKDKIVLVGGTATALFDFKPSPFSELFPGLEVHAHVLDNYFQRNFLKPVSHSSVWIIILLLGGLGGIVLPRTKPWIGALYTLIAILGYLGMAYWAFSSKNLLFHVVPVGLSIMVVYVAILFYRMLTEEREKRWIRNTFQQYLSPKVIEVLQTSPEKLNLGGEDKEMTVFFSDLAGFTSISEALAPEQLAQVLNEYLTEMSDIIMRHDGVIDKYMGDAIMAFWNAPVDQPDHAKLACFSALEQLERLDRLREEFSARGLPDLNCRIGINTGRMKVGNFGSKQRFDYTVMGDSVNLGSRLEGANKSFHTRCMIAESTYNLTKDVIVGRELDLLRVKGKAKPVRVFEIISRKGDLSSDTEKGLKFYHEGLWLFRDKKFSGAIQRFNDVLEYMPDDGPSLIYIERCQTFKKTPPPKNWDGVFVMTTK